MFTLVSDILQGRLAIAGQRGPGVDGNQDDVYYDIITASGTTWAECLEHAMVSRDGAEPISIHDLPGELYDLAKEDLRVAFHQAYEEALEASS